MCSLFDAIMWCLSGGSPHLPSFLFLTTIPNLILSNRFLVVSHARTEAQKLSETGLAEILGRPEESFWAMLRTNYGSQEQRDRECLGLMLYGDEADALGTSFMALNWRSESSFFLTNADLSRFVITVFEKERYVMSESGANMTLQAILHEVVQSCNLWSSQKIAGYYGVVTTIKGDWKFLRQSLSLTRHYNANSVCLHCLATKGMTCPYTDVSATAAWRDTQGVNMPWLEQEPPALTHLYNFRLSVIGLDLLHIWHLGLARDVIGSVMVILLRARNFFCSHHEGPDS